MKKIKFKEIFEIKKGKKVEPVDESFPNKVRYIQIEDLRDDRSVKYCFHDDNYVYANSESIIVAWDGANAGTVSYGLEGAIGSTLAVLEAKTKDIYIPFVGKFLQSKFQYLRDTCTGATIPHISRKALENLLIPMPSFEEQVFISKILDKAQSLVETRKAQIEALDQLTQSVFLEMFGDIRINSKKYKQVKLNEVITKITTGKSLAGEGISEYKVLKTSAVSYKFFKQNEVKYLPQDYVPPVSHIVNKGDVLVSRMNTSELVGAAAYVFNEIKNIALPDRIWKLHYSRKINPIFLWYFINQSYFRDKVTDIATGTSGSMKNISQKKYLNLSILLPDISLQNKFAEFVYKIQIEKDKMDKGLIELNNIFNSLMQHTFNGKLFPE